MNRPQVRGIVIEGLEYAGKTSLAQAVAARLEYAGKRVESSHGTLTGGHVIDTLHAQQMSLFEQLGGGGFREGALWHRFNSSRSGQLMIDAERAADEISERAAVRRSGDAAIRVQDRYWLTQHCFNSLLTPDGNFLSDRWIRSRAPRFTVQVYVTCSLPTRLARRQLREPKHAINRFLDRHLAEVVQLDRAFCTELANDPEWLILHSDERSPEDIADELVTRFVQDDR